MIKIILCGCLGRMGTAVHDLVAQTVGMEIVAGVDVVTRPALYPMYTNIADCQVAADVVIDFLPPTAVDDTLKIVDYCAEKSLPLIVCTTALPENVQGYIEKAEEKIAVLQSANLSLGLNLFINLLGQAAKMLHHVDFDIEIMEKHHNKKLDAPSGTAVVLANAINHALGGQMEIVHDRTGVHEPRKRNQIGVHAIRGGSIVGEHSVLFAGLGETLEFTHSAVSREVFAVGAVRAAQFMAGKSAGMYTMQDLVQDLVKTL